MSLAIDVFLLFGTLCLAWACVAPFRYPDTNFLFRGLNFVPANLALRVFCGLAAVRSAADLAERYGMPALMQALKTQPIDAIIAIALLTAFLLFALGVWIRRA